MKFQAIIFDLFGTLVPYIGEKEFNSSLHPLSKILEVNISTIKEFWSTEKGYYKAITEYSTTYQRIIEFCNVIKIKSDIKIEEAVKSRLSVHSEWLKPKKTTIETLKKIKSQEIKVGMISDCSAEVPEIWETTSISKHVDVCVFSCIEKMNKSGSRIFNLCCERLNVHSEKILYVGDSKEELLKAEELGMKSILMKTRKKVNWQGISINRPLDIVDYLNMGK